MATKWQKYSYRGDRCEDTDNVLNLKDGTPDPWDVYPSGCALGTTFISGYDPTYYKYGAYRNAFTVVDSGMSYCSALVAGTLGTSRIQRRTEYVKLERLHGDKIILGKRARPMYYVASRGDVQKHWVVPFFDTKGSSGKTLSVTTFGCVFTTNPPRAIIRKMGSDNFVLDVVAGSSVYYYGKYSSFDSAMEGTRQLFMTCLIEPESIPESVNAELNREYYGRLFHEALPIPEQLRRANYFMALNVLTCCNPHMLSRFKTSFRKQFWEDPKSVVDMVLAFPNEAKKNCYDDDYASSQRAMRHLLPKLKGMYLKALAPIFKLGLTVTEEEYKMQEYAYGSQCCWVTP